MMMYSAFILSHVRQPANHTLNRTIATLTRMDKFSLERPQEHPNEKTCLHNDKNSVPFIWECLHQSYLVRRGVINCHARTTPHILDHVCFNRLDGTIEKAAAAK